MVDGVSDNTERFQEIADFASVGSAVIDACDTARYVNYRLAEITHRSAEGRVDAAGDQVLTVFTPRPGSPEHDAIRLLASWNARSSSPSKVESPSEP